jgi:hypothetical protein
MTTGSPIIQCRACSRTSGTVGTGTHEVGTGTHDWWLGHRGPYYPALGRPSIDPVLMIRMLILGYAFGLRSERLLCREVKVNLAYRWFCGLSIEDKIPDHSAFSRARNAITTFLSSQIMSNGRN